MDSSRSRLLPMPRNNPFPQRPWMENNGAAAATGGASGMKGKIYSFLIIFLIEYSNFI